MIAQKVATRDGHGTDLSIYHPLVENYLTPVTLDAPPDPRDVARRNLYSPDLLNMLTRKCPAIRIHRSGSQNEAIPPAARAGLGQVLLQFKGGTTTDNAVGGTHSDSNQQEAAALRQYSCAEAKADGCSACPAGGCPMPNGHRAEKPTDLLAWDETPLKEVDDLVVAESVFLNEFEAAPVLVNGEALHYQEGAFRSGLDAALVDKAYRHLQSPRTLLMARKIVKNLKDAYAVHRDDFVPSPDFICFSNGTLNVTTRAMEAHSPKHYLVNAIPQAYVQGATCPTFLTFLDDIWRDDADKPDKLRLIRQWMGYLLTADASQHKMLLLYGQGRNGKSVLMQLIHAMVGAGNTTSAMPASLHVASVRARLARTLLNLCSDLPLDEVISAGVIKATVAGEPLEASHKHKGSHTVYQYTRLMMGSNHLPKTKDFTAGYFDRLIILSFNRYFEEGERDPDLLDKLKAEMPGIVAWAVEGLYDLRAEKKLTIPPLVRDVEGQVCDRGLAGLNRHDNRRHS
jgi:putative DNA primase/helicase